MRMNPWSGERTRPGCSRRRPAGVFRIPGETPRTARETRALPGPSARRMALRTLCAGVCALAVAVFAAKAVAATEGVPLIDLERITREMIIEAGPEGSKEFFVIFGRDAVPGHPQGREDNTHFSEAGARRVAAAAAAEMTRLGTPFVSP